MYNNLYITCHECIKDFSDVPNGRVYKRYSEETTFVMLLLKMVCILSGMNLLPKVEPFLQKHVGAVEGVQFQ